MRQRVNQISPRQSYSSLRRSVPGQGGILVAGTRTCLAPLRTELVHSLENVLFLGMMLRRFVMEAIVVSLQVNAKP